MSSTYDLVVQAGDDTEFVVTWAPDGGVPDLTDATAEMAIVWEQWQTRSGLVAAGSLLLTTEDGITIDEETGGITVDISGEGTEDIPASYATYQLRVTEASGRKTTIASGKFTANRNLIPNA